MVTRLCAVWDRNQEGARSPCGDRGEDARGFIYGVPPAGDTHANDWDRNWHNRSVRFNSLLFALHNATWLPMLPLVEEQWEQPTSTTAAHWTHHPANVPDANSQLQLPDDGTTTTDTAMPLWGG